MSFSFAPKSWALCDGQLLAINQNQALFALLGTTYGGNGQTSFALPDFRGCTPIHAGSGHTLGERGGEQAHTLTVSELPTHTHVASASASAATATIPTGSLVLAQAEFPLYRAPSSLVTMDAATLATTGGSQAHTNMQPFLTLSFCIALQGIFPSQS